MIGPEDHGPILKLSINCRLSSCGWSEDSDLIPKTSGKCCVHESVVGRIIVT